MIASDSWWFAAESDANLGRGHSAGSSGPSLAPIHSVYTPTALGGPKLLPAAKPVSARAEWIPRQMTPCEAAWVAGIVDGEGTINIRTKPYPGGKRYQVVSLSVPNTDVSLIARVIEYTGIGRVRLSVRESEERKAMWCWKTDQRQAAAIVRQVLPWLTAKAAHGVLLLEMQSLRRPGKYRPGEKERQLEIIEEFRELNRRRLNAAATGSVAL